jgi:hypothetical protein
MLAMPLMSRSQLERVKRGCQEKGLSASVSRLQSSPPQRPQWRLMGRRTIWFICKGLGCIRVAIRKVKMEIPANGRLKAFAALLPALFFGAIVAAASNEWSTWRQTDDQFLQWRSRVISYNSNISPDCLFEFQRSDDREVNFNYEVLYDPSPGSTGRRKGQAYGISKSEHGRNVISGCKNITQIAVSGIKAKMVTGGSGGRGADGVAGRAANHTEPNGISYMVLSREEITKAAVDHCSSNEHGQPNLGVFRRELRAYSQSSGGGNAVRFWRETIDVFVHCREH